MVRQHPVSTRQMKLQHPVSTNHPWGKWFANTRCWRTTGEPCCRLDVALAADGKDEGAGGGDPECRRNDRLRDARTRQRGAE